MSLKFPLTLSPLTSVNSSLSSSSSFSFYSSISSSLSPISEIRSWSRIWLRQERKYPSKKERNRKLRETESVSRPTDRSRSSDTDTLCNLVTVNERNAMTANEEWAINKRTNDEWKCVHMGCDACAGVSPVCQSCDLRARACRGGGGTDQSRDRTNKIVWLMGGKKLTH